MVATDLTRAVKVLKQVKTSLDSLEANGVDLSEYPKKTEVNAGIAAGVTEAKTYTDQREVAITTAYNKAINDAITALKGVAPETLDTLQEIADALQNNPDVIKDILEQLGKKATAADLTTHINNVEVHVTAANKTDWNSRVTQSELTAATTVSDEALKSWLVTTAGE